jgi:hypothetical protein
VEEIEVDMGLQAVIVQKVLDMEQKAGVLVIFL